MTSSLSKWSATSYHTWPILDLKSMSVWCCMISWLITSKAWSTGILVKRADTSKETNSSLSCRLMDCSLSVRSLESLTKDEVCPTYTFKILVKYLARLYVDVPQAETMGRIGQLALCIFGRP